MIVLELSGVERTFPGPPPVTALRPTDFAIAEGELWTVTGPSGAGKSTLLSLAGLLDRPSGGEVLVAGHPTRDLPERTRTAIRGQWLGFVFQTFHLLARRSVVENVMLSSVYAGLPARQRREQALRAIDDVGLSHRAYSTANTLSGGEKQRVAIARALAGSPRLLLCDEPTGNLDSATSAEIIDLLLTVNRAGTALLIVSHDPDVAAITPRRLHVTDGQVNDHS